MDLFSDYSTNILSKDGEVYYFGKIFSDEISSKYLDCLLNTIDWKNDELILFGKKIITKRKVAWYGDEPYQYTYSHSTKKAIYWTKELFEIKLIIEKITNEKYNSCLLNLYHSGEEGMSWHCDDEKELVKHSSIASISFGADRKFVFKHKFNSITKSLILENGSLLEMKGKTQEFWLHKLPPTKKSKMLRVNLTFRKINNSF